MKISCSACDNATCLIKLCHPAWILKVELNKSQSRVRAGESIFREGERINGIYFILHGKVKVVSEGIEEKEQIVRLATDGHILGHGGDKNEKYPVGAIALSESTLCFVDNAFFYEVCINNPQFDMGLSNFYSKELRKAEMRLKYLGQMNVREKTAQAILYLKDVFGMNPEDKSLYVYLTRQEIAAITGASQGEVIRQLTEFEKEGLLSKNNKKLYLLNFEELKKITERSFYQ